MNRVIGLTKKLDIDRSIAMGSIMLLGLFAAQAVGVYVTLWQYGLLGHFKPQLYAGILYYSLGLVVFVKGISYSLRYLSYEDGARGIIRVRQDFREGWFNVSYLVAFMVPMVCLPTFMALFSSMKSTIHLIQPFYLDELLMKADRFIHFGIDPWRITHAIFNSAIASAILNYFYNLWFFIMFSYVLWHIVNVHFGKERLQFLLAFVLVWPVIGSLLAVLFSSAGPVYYGDIVGDNSIYGPMMDILRHYHSQFENSAFGIFALNTQDMLWADYLKNDTNIGSGISAMPSMHVAVTALLYFSGRQMHRYIGYGMLVFLVIIQIGSVHLGWHYAIDGYVSIFLTWLIWRVSGWVVRRFVMPNPAQI
ncbi:phosphatase PAP2 family protein [Paremcibacter congregatus]|uniref:Inositolphosphotransferase Aur1/Ipt1 domain-containing protein n=1 Tax=Paremcibacter congregatus TaxID=2043170 RepID=A0A2G4YU44_9PROT|nr:phosphatase PAP2 family protein [Paremcibacter congregatus]PHZ85862.1 hypothetical protein CRD36_04070 [Paremcibacter congregatus]QDE26826.1 PAP2 family protein [Paremcibacter congregatus]